MPLAAGTGSIFGGVHDFFDSDVWRLIVVCVLIVLCVLWAASVYGVFRDARVRIRNPWLVGIPVALASALPFLGALLWRAVRPPDSLDDVRARDLEIALLERMRGAAPCLGCGHPVASDYLACPVCALRLREACGDCARPLDPSWQVCPYCEHPVERVAFARAESEPAVPRPGSEAAAGSPL